MEDQKLNYLFQQHIQNQPHPDEAMAKKLWDRYRLEQQKQLEFDKQKNSQKIIWLTHAILILGISLLIWFLQQDYLTLRSVSIPDINVEISQSPLLWGLLLLIIIFFLGLFMRDAFFRRERLGVKE